MKLQNPHLIAYSTSKNAKCSRYYYKFVKTVIGMIAALTIINIIKN